MRLTAGMISALVLVALGAGCGSLAGRPAAVEQPSAGRLVWPPPPASPRILFVKALARPEDLGIQPSFWQRLGEIFGGKEEEWMIRPTGVAVRSAVIYVADAGAQALWILDPSSGEFLKIQKAGDERLVSPVAVAFGPGGLVYLADSFLAKVFAYGEDKKLKKTIADARLRRPAGLAYDGARDRLYVADSLAHQIFVFAGDGKQMGTIGRRGSGDGEFNFPTHLAVGRDGALWVTDSLGFRVQSFSPDGAFTGKFGRHGDTSGQVAMPKGVAVDSRGRIYLVDALFDAVQIFNREGQWLMTFGERGIGHGQFWLPGGLFIDPQDRIYVADSYNQRIQVFDYVVGADNE